MAYWPRQLAGKKNPPHIITLGDGVNTYINPFQLSPKEGSSSLNTCNQSYPALSTRRGRTSMYGSAATPLTSVNGATARAGTTFHVVTGTTWKYWNGSSYTNVATGLTDAQAKFIEFTTATKKYTIMFNGTEKKAWDGSTVTDLTDAQATRVIAANDSRLFNLIDSSVYASDIGDITNWTTGDSDRIGQYGMVGSGTALVTYNDMIIAFSDQTMHIIFGKTSDEFDPTEPIIVGNVSDKATIIHGDTGVLYWLDYNRFMAFTGGTPFDVSEKVITYLESINYTYKSKICAGQSGKYIYLSIPYGATATENNLTLVYDTNRKMWYPHNVGYTDFFNIGQYLYGIDTDGVVWKLDQTTADDSTAISWEHTTGVMDFEPIKNLKHITDIYAIVDLPTASTLKLYYSATVDGSLFNLIKQFTASEDYQKVRIRIPTTKFQRADWYRFKLTGTGPCTVHYLEIHGRRGE